MIYKKGGAKKKYQEQEGPAVCLSWLLEQAEKICWLKVEEGEGSSNPRLWKNGTQLPSNPTSYTLVPILCSQLLNMYQIYSKIVFFCPSLLARARLCCRKK